ncbi:hypothetical protein MMC18_009499 [Xylographa bjoerkii]|nr:hypothetical protein [Xylographa bjoerkii]
MGRRPKHQTDADRRQYNQQRVAQQRAEAVTRRVPVGPATAIPTAPLPAPIQAPAHAGFVSNTTTNRIPRSQDRITKEKDSVNLIAPKPLIPTDPWLYNLYAASSQHDSTRRRSSSSASSRINTPFASGDKLSPLKPGGEAHGFILPQLQGLRVQDSTTPALPPAGLAGLNAKNDDNDIDPLSPDNDGSEAQGSTAEEEAGWADYLQSHKTANVAPPDTPQLPPRNLGHWSERESTIDRLLESSNSQASDIAENTFGFVDYNVFNTTPPRAPEGTYNSIISTIERDEALYRSDSPAASPTNSPLVLPINLSAILPSNSPVASPTRQGRNAPLIALENAGARKVTAPPGSARVPSNSGIEIRVPSYQQWVDQNKLKAQRKSEVREGAQMVLQNAWKPWCTCGQSGHASVQVATNKTGELGNDPSPLPSTPSNRTLSEMTQYIHSHTNPQSPIPTDLLSGSLFSVDAKLGRNDVDECHNTIAWKAILAGAHETQKVPPKLDFARSHNECLADPQLRDLTIRRVWDVDSIICLATTIAVHKGGFNLAYRPPFLRRITQNPNVLFNSVAIHKQKNLRVGLGLYSGGFDYQCHAIFPKMEVYRETQLTDQQMKVWIDQIVLPALKLACPVEILQRHPRSFEDALAKASSKKEHVFEGHHQHIDLRYPIPEKYLAAFSMELLRLTSLTSIHLTPDAVGNPRLDFSGCFFIIQAHNLKVVTSRPTLNACREDFISHLHTVFHFNPRNFPYSTCWLDLGMDDTPDPGPGPAVTLLRKTHCTKLWTKSFESPETSAQHLQVAIYHWAATRDSCSASVALTSNNIWCQQHLIAYNKAYNIHKDLWTTPLKNDMIWDNPQFEALAFTQDTLADWLKVNDRRRSSFGNTKAEKIRTQFYHTVNRTYVSLRDSMNTTFGVRQEYRVGFDFFENLSANADQTPDSGVVFPYPESDNGGSQSSTTQFDTHPPYWILRTKDANEFFAAQLNRWLLYVKIINGATLTTPHCPEPVGRQRQLIDGVLLAAILRLIRMSFSSFVPSSRPGIWKEEYTTRPRKRLGPGGAPTAAVPRRRLWGFGQQKALAKYGLAWLPAKLIIWASVTLTTEAIRHLQQTNDAFQVSFKKSKAMRNVLVEGEHFVQEFRDRLAAAIEKLGEGHEEALGRVYNQAAELIVQSYIQEVYRVLSIKANPRKKFSQVTYDALLEPLTENERRGLAGLSFALVKIIYSGQRPSTGTAGSEVDDSSDASDVVHAPHVVLTRSTRPDGRSRNNGTAHFAQYNSGSWSGKLQALFTTDDELTRPRAWDTAKFRTLARQLGSIVKSMAGGDHFATFQARIFKVAAEKLWLVFQFDVDHFCCSRKISKLNTKATQNALNALTPLSLVSWLVPILRAPYREIFQRAIEDGPPGTIRARRDYGTLQMALKNAEFDVASQGSWRGNARWARRHGADGIPRDPSIFEVDLTLTHAAEFQQAVGRRVTAGEVSTSESEVPSGVPGSSSSGGGDAISLCSPGVGDNAALDAGSASD